MPLLHEAVRLATDRMPKTVKPSTHALADYAIAGSFFVMAALFWRRNRRAAMASLICGGAAAVNIVLTEYPGGAFDSISYKTHGHVDRGLAGIAAVLPKMMGFSEEPEARAFTTMALVATTVTSLTDFEER
jgi:peptidoglycan/LPS O-acetylase OafA/YrhL